MSINTPRNVWVTADEHYGHTNIIKYCNRPFASVDEMDSILIEKHNKLVKELDVVLHVGDFTLRGPDEALKYISRLRGIHFFIPGSHDNWIDRIGEKQESDSGVKIFPEIYHFAHQQHHVILCHYAMRVWPRSHYGSYHFYGHSHGMLKQLPNRSMDIGVDCHNYEPVNLDAAIHFLRNNANSEIKQEEAELVASIEKWQGWD